MAKSGAKTGAEGGSEVDFHIFIVSDIEEDGSCLELFLEWKIYS